MIIKNISLSNTQSINQIKKIGIVPFPYTFFNSIRAGGSTSHREFSPVDYEKRSSYLYVLPRVNSLNDKFIILNQAYEKNWRAYAVNDNMLLSNYLPFLFGNRIQNHVLINNWANGWTLAEVNNPYIVILFVPQYLLFFGIVLFALYFTLLIKESTKEFKQYLGLGRGGK